MVVFHSGRSAEYPCSRIRAAQFSRSGRPKRGNLESCGGKKCTCAHLGSLHLNCPEAVLFGRPDRTSEKRPIRLKETALGKYYIFALYRTAMKWSALLTAQFNLPIIQTLD